MTANFLQNSLFDEVQENPLEKISGLTYISDFITPAQEKTLIQTIDGQLWLIDLKRRVQHYGWKYDYTARNVTSDLKLGELPDWVAEYVNTLHKNGIFPKIPDQVIINEYQPGQGISSHVDCVPCFAEIIASLSLGSLCVMDFIHSDTNEKISILLEPRSLILLSGNARYKWKHGIASRKTDKYNGSTFSHSRRISITFRNVIIDTKNS